MLKLNCKINTTIRINYAVFVTIVVFIGHYKVEIRVVSKYLAFEIFKVEVQSQGRNVIEEKKACIRKNYIQNA